VLHGQEQHSTPTQVMTGEGEVEAHVEQVTPEEHEAHHEAPEEHDGLSSEDSVEVGAPHWGD
jgi:hypothetical protein